MGDSVIVVSWGLGKSDCNQAGSSESPGADRHVDGVQSSLFGFDSANGLLFQECGRVGGSGCVILVEKGCVRLFDLPRSFLLEQAFVRLVANGLDRLIQADDVSSPRQRGRTDWPRRVPRCRPVLRSRPVCDSARPGSGRPSPGRPTRPARLAPSTDCSLSFCDSIVSVKRVPTKASDVSFRETSWAVLPGELVSERPDDPPPLSSS